MVYILMQTPNKCYNTSLPAHGFSTSPDKCTISEAAETLKVLMDTPKVGPNEVMFSLEHMPGWHHFRIIDEPSKSSKETVWLIIYFWSLNLTPGPVFFVCYSNLVLNHGRNATTLDSRNCCKTWARNTRRFQRRELRVRLFRKREVWEFKKNWGWNTKESTNKKHNIHHVHKNITHPQVSSKRIQY